MFVVGSWVGSCDPWCCAGARSARAHARERERVCVCVCVCLRERGTERICWRWCSRKTIPGDGEIERRREREFREIKEWRYSRVSPQKSRDDEEHIVDIVLVRAAEVDRQRS